MIFKLSTILKNFVLNLHMIIEARSRKISESFDAIHQLFLNNYYFKNLKRIRFRLIGLKIGSNI